uniref:Uncharacterized protein n=1 Tax=Candidatus Kentrum sp. LPFa TaxID=2126335 RepID=A0A450Y0V0_9GAMM|nr:MAG: hypothetical protein BECKLPF1236C_GA0070990_103408 [Candidatus Kentron sp. LPFa]
MHGKNSSALSMLEKIPRNVTTDSDIVTADSGKVGKSVTIRRNTQLVGEKSIFGLLVYALIAGSCILN